MVVQKTPRLGLEKYTEGSDTHPNRAKFNSEREVLDALIALARQGTTAERPVPGLDRRLFWDTTVKRLFWDDGTDWNEITTNGGGGAGGKLIPGAAGVEGTSERSARADHTHLLAMATASIDGAMSSTDKAKLDAASSTATPGSLVQLDSNGRTQIANPATGADAANKTYVDTQVGTRAPESHTHTPAQITGTLSPSQLPAASQSAAGAFSAADKKKLDSASSSSAANTIMMTDANGRYSAVEPSSGVHVANKTYVDTQISGRSPSNHTHSWSQISAKPSTFTPSGHNHNASDITSGIINPARINNASTSADGLMSAADKRALNSVTSKLPDAIARGTEAVSTILSGNIHNGYIDFPPGRFSSTPQVFLQSTHSRITAGIGSTSTTKAYFTVANYTDSSTGGASTLHWVAIQ